MRYILKGMLGIIVGISLMGGLLFLRIRYAPLDLTFLKPFLTKFVGEDIGWEKMQITWSSQEGIMVKMTELHHPSFQAYRLNISTPLGSVLKKESPQYHMTAEKVKVDCRPQGKSSGGVSVHHVTSFLKKCQVKCDEVTVLIPQGHTLGQISIAWDGHTGTLMQNKQEVGTVTSHAEGQVTFDIKNLSVPMVSFPGELLIRGDLKIEGRILLTPSKEEVIFDIRQKKGNSLSIVKKNQTVTVENMWVKGDWMPETLSAQGAVTVGGAKLSFQAHDTASQGCGPGERKIIFDLSQDAGAVNIKDLPLLWPESVAVSAREWILTNFHEGEIHVLKGRISLCLPAQGEMIVQDLKGKLGIRSIKLSFMEEMPCINDLEAISDVTLKGFDIRLIKGMFHKQQVTGGTIHIGPLVDLPQLKLGLSLEGPFDSLVHIMSRFSSLKDVPLKDLKGRSITKVTAHFPLLAELKKDQIRMTIDSGVSDACFKITVAKRDLSVGRGTIRIQGSEKCLSVKGKSDVEGIPTQWSWSDKGCLSFKSRIVPEQIAPLFHVDVTPYIHSPFDITGQYNAHKTTACLNLTKADCSLPWIFWKKPAGVPLEIRAEVSGASQEKTFTVKILGALMGKVFMRVNTDHPLVMAELKADGDWCKYRYQNHEHRLFFRGRRVRIEEPPSEKEAQKKSLMASQGKEKVPEKTLSELIQKQTQIYLKKIKKQPIFSKEVNKTSLKTTLPSQISLGQSSVLSVTQGTKQPSEGKKLPQAQWHEELEKQNHFYLTLSQKNLLQKSDKNPQKALQQRSVLSSSEPSPQQSSPSLKKKPLVVHIPKVASQGKAISPHYSHALSEKFYLDIECDELLAGEVRLLRCYARVQGHSLDPQESFLKFSNIRWDHARAFATVIKKKNPRKKTAKKGHFIVSVQSKAGGNSIIQLDATDLGALLSGFGMTDKVKAGRIHLIAQQDPRGVYTGFVKAMDFKTKAPFLGKLIAMISPMMVTELFSSGLFFHEVSGHFHYHKGQLTLDQGVGKGINLGVSLRGKVNCEDSTAALSGAIIPGYLLNTFFRYVPFLGWLLGGDKGIVSTEFKLKGSLLNPKIRIEPFSIFKFGFVKDLFSDPSDQLTWEKDFLKDHKIP